MPYFMWKKPNTIMRIPKGYINDIRISSKFTLLLIVVFVTKKLERRRFFT